MRYRPHQEEPIQDEGVQEEVHNRLVETGVWLLGGLGIIVGVSLITYAVWKLIIVTE